MLGYGLSAKPDRPYTMALQADIAAAFVAALGVDRLALLTHDMGDTVGGELLARRAEGAWPVEVTHRVVTNGSIYIEQAHLTNGQQLLLGLPDAAPARRLPIDAASITQSLRDTFSADTPLVPAGWPEDPVPPAAAQVVHDDGHRVLPRLIRYIEERRANERRFTGAIESDPAPLHVVWGLDDPIAVPSMVDTLVAARPAATAVAPRRGGSLPHGRGAAALPRRGAARPRLRPPRPPDVQAGAITFRLRTSVGQAGVEVGHQVVAQRTPVAGRPSGSRTGTGRRRRCRARRWRCPTPPGPVAVCS